MKKVLFFLVLSVWLIAEAQVVWFSPAFPSLDDSMTIYFNANEGSGGMSGMIPPVAYMHAGLITSKSESNSDWKYVQGNWGQDDERVKMVSLGNDLYSKKIHPRTFYGVPKDEEVLRFAFVFRNNNGSRSGRSESGGDIFVDYVGDNFNASIVSPKDETFYDDGEELIIKINSSKEARLSLKMNDTIRKEENGMTMVDTVQVKGQEELVFHLIAQGQDSTIYDTVRLVERRSSSSSSIPAGIQNGLNVLDDSTVVFCLYAPYKESIHVIGDFNDWRIEKAYQMFRDTRSNRFWLKVSGLDPDLEYGYQYRVDDLAPQPDPFSALVLDGQNDGLISETTYPNLKRYPYTKTSGYVSVFKIRPDVFNWKHDNYDRPKKTDLVIYELLVRDFTDAANYQTIIDSLDYFTRLGINAIEFLPVSEFEFSGPGGSWGYDQSLHMAFEKMYGTRQQFKQLVDECHKRGIAVILDAVFNHAFGSSPLVRMWWDASMDRPSTQSPYFNPVAKHPFNVGYDFNHESGATQEYMDRVIRYWLEEFHVDGFRFDLSKGFTQQNSGENVEKWGQYDQSRVDLLKRMRNEIRTYDTSAFLILEHFADNSEDRVLADIGFLIWGNLNHDYAEASMGFSSNLRWSTYKQRGYKDPNLITFMESHDEQRVNYKIQKWGAVAADYNVKDLGTACDRMELAGVFLFTIPGPKMLWQFGELGYDIPIDQNGRTGQKPILWEYEDNWHRRDLQLLWSRVIRLRIQEDIFETRNFRTNFGPSVKSITLSNDDMHALVVGNFGTASNRGNHTFQTTGWWYEFFSGDSMEISSTTQTLDLKAGEYRIYLSKKVPDYLSSEAMPSSGENRLRIYPNPAENMLNIGMGSTEPFHVQIIDLKGTVLRELKDVHDGNSAINVQDLAPGIYVLRVKGKQKTYTKRWIKS